jgi:hypothetical protein
MTVILHEPEAADAKYLTIWRRVEADPHPVDPGQGGWVAMSAAASLGTAAGDGEPTWEDAAWQ